MGGLTFIGGLIVLLLLFSALSVITDDSGAPLHRKVFNTAYNLIDGTMEVFLKISRFASKILNNQEGVETANKAIEKLRAFYGFRNDKHIGCCRSAECYVNNICNSKCVDCSKTEQNLKVYYAS